jgi:hypothetical protein
VPEFLSCYLPSRVTLLVLPFLGPEREILVEEPGLEHSQEEAPEREILVEKSSDGNTPRMKVLGEKCSRERSPELSQCTPKYTPDRTLTEVRQARLSPVSLGRLAST